MQLEKMSGITIAIIAIVVFVGIMIYSAQTLLPQLQNPEFILSEAQIQKTETIQIKDGEIYKYKYIAGNASANITYSVSYDGICTWVSVVGGEGMVCLDQNGNDKAARNSSYSTPAIVLMKPWMLAVHKDWEWNVSSYMVFDEMAQHVSDTDYEVIREEQYKGRDAFVVKINSSDGNEVWDWVDKDKRILLREVGLQYEVVLVEGLEFE
jgi:hypothetical protein